MSEPVRYARTPLPAKLGIGPGDAVALIGAPDWLEQTLASLPGGAVVQTDLAGGALFDVIVVFVAWRAELQAEIARLRDRMAPACGLWVAWPGRASQVPTDLTDDVVREIALPAGLADDTVCDIDQTWTGLRLVIRREDR